MKIKVPTKAVNMAINLLGKVKQYSPQIMMAVGAATSVAAVVEAVKQTPKAIDILEEHKKELETFKEVLDEKPEQYQVADYKKDTYALCIRTGLKLTKTFAMPMIMEAASLICFFGAHKIMSNRNKTLSVALATMTDAYNSYRNKMIEALGEEKEEQIRLGTTKDKITKEITDKSGEVKKVTERIDVVDPSNIGPYDILWVEGDPGFDQSEELRTLYKANVADMWTKFIYETKVRDKVPLAEINKYFKDNKEAYSNELNIVAGYKQSDDDKRVIIRSKNVEVKQPNGLYLDGEVLSFNVQGSIVPSIIK
jgi:hypothetical protein